jgi:hypothetical protein
MMKSVVRPLALTRRFLSHSRVRLGQSGIDAAFFSTVVPPQHSTTLSPPSHNSNHPSSSSLPPPSLLSTYAVEAPDGTNQELESRLEQDIVNEYVEVEAEHSFCQHCLENHIDFVGPVGGPVKALHPMDLRKPVMASPVDANHLLAVTPEDIARAELEEYERVAVCLEDLHFGPYPSNMRTNENPDQYAGVESPDGTPDYICKDDLAEVDHLIEEAAKTEDKAFVKELHAQQEEMTRIIAVDAPDGESDGNAQTNVAIVQDIIEQASQRENADEIRTVHQENQAILDTLDQLSPRNPWEQ